MQRPLIIALDFPSLQEVNGFLARFSGEHLYVKVGMELFYQEGPAIIHHLKEQGHSIFLDLKLHDIPNTVKSAMKGLAKLGVDLTNVHCAGGTNMMEAALEGLDQGTPSGEKRPHLIGVTQLTSTSEQLMKEQLLIDHSLNDVVVHYASLAKRSGLEGVVCSSLEVPLIREALGKEFMTITPGIRLASDDKGDQTRIVTPELARELGASGIVVGRSITKAVNPLESYSRIKKGWEGVLI
ncbi:orotidine-5'-phosphate decarboxylase [Bacillus sp. PS06]|uniref:orotidine-5'-phosphate decarboxylase n=1 Tax=Bacillus sp. PS06 TaxID=2764176 RepID=UPI00178511C6|nr:orotidine-5'-phosphate decarboxylase [Bacillus sp. PS06]MBD8068360.1 orotidine-5'-phosphate decarboxylase [Bacillus sp. PS06]